ncbi:MAG: Ppx/GppA family phosphatase [Proteobacteria bacterium]|nr:Ppx/GppA family phosphatase [Pseudomonadota bacterium]
MDARTKPNSTPTIWTIPSRVAVIDVGSNTLRLVAFEYQGRIPQLIFNEKAFCGLGRSLATSKLLDDETMAMALETIHRFVTLTDQMGVDHLAMVATAAVREAENGHDLVSAVESMTGRSLKVLSGEEEARLAALGVLAGIPEANGVAGDLGGGSLELVGIDNGNVRGGESLPLGTLRLMDAHDGDQVVMGQSIDRSLDQLEWLGDVHGRNFYPVGGTWRALARLHMAVRDYPLRILHQYKIDGAEALQFVREIDHYLEDAALANSGVSKKRIPMLPTAALVLERVLLRIEPKMLVISALGVREGILYDHAPAEVHAMDPLITFCRDMAHRRSRFPEHGDDLMHWVAPVFGSETDEERRLRHAVCLLTDIAWSGHPDYRAELAMDQIMLAQVMGADHPERAAIGLALFVLNGGGIDHPSAKRARSLLTEAEVERARTMGLALRLAQRISGGTKELLSQSALEMDGDQLVLKIEEGGGYMIGEAVERRLGMLASSLNRKPAIRVDG